MTAALTWAAMTVLALFPWDAEAKIYIDVVSSPRKLPIAVQDFSGPQGRQISEIISADLDFSGVFEPIDSAAFLEQPGQDFNRSNWTTIGAEAVVKGEVTEENGSLTITAYLYDAFEGKQILRKRYLANNTLLRPLAHSIADDIYQKITGRKGVFRSKIAYIATRGGKRELTLSDWDGHRMRPLKTTTRVLLAPQWSRDGSKMLYSGERNRKWIVYLLDLKSMKETVVFSMMGTNLAGDFFPGNEEFALSSSKAGTPDIYVYDMVRSKLRRLTSAMGIEVSPAVSTDGERVAYVSDGGGTPQIYTMDKFGYNRTRVTFEGNYNTSPAWSPRDDVLAFCGRHEGRNQIFIVRPDGSGLKILTSQGNNEEPSFSPDGRYITFSSDRDGTKGIYIMRADGEGQVRISPRGIKAFAPRWSKE